MNYIKIFTLTAVVADFVISTLSFSFKLYLDKLLATEHSLTADDINAFEEAFLKCCNDESDVIDLTGTINTQE